MAFNHEALYAELRNQIKTATGLPDTRVLWAGISNDRTPSQDYVLLTPLSVTPIYELPEASVTDNPASTLGDGEEILLNFYETAEMILEIQCVSTIKDGQYPRAAHTAETIRNYFALDTSDDAFLTVGATIVDRSPVRHFTTVLNTILESRAVLEVRVRYGSNTSRTETFIETVETPDFDLDD